MQNKTTPLSQHGRKILEILHKSDRPLTAYALLEKMHRFGVKAPPTIYRALETLTERGLIHRIETLNAFVACDEEGEHGAQFAVCRSCGTVTELHDHRLAEMIRALAKSLKFHLEREMLELMGLCERCDQKRQEA